MPKTMTPKAIAANRANAKKSTGPRTPEGKARSSRNAVTHGVLADALTAPSLEPYEDPAAFQALLAGLRAEHAPATDTEDILVQSIALTTWRLQRLARAESGAIAQAHCAAVAANERRAAILDVVARDSAAIQAALDSGDMDRLRAVLDPDGLYPSTQVDWACKALAGDQIARAQAETRAQNAYDPQAALDMAALPDPDLLERYARYDAHLKRQLHRDLATLRQLKADRIAATAPANAANPPSDPAPGDAGTPPSGATPGHRRRTPPRRGAGSPACPPAAKRRGESPASAHRRHARPAPNQASRGRHFVRAGGRPAAGPNGAAETCPAAIHLGPPAPTSSRRHLHPPLRQPAPFAANAAPNPFPLGGSAAPAGGTVGGHPTAGRTVGAPPKTPKIENEAISTPGPPGRRAPAPHHQEARHGHR